MIDITIKKRPEDCPSCGRPIEDPAVGCVHCAPVEEPAAETPPEAPAEEEPAREEHEHAHGGHTHNIPPGESPRWLDDDENVKKLALGVYIAAGLVFVFELFDLVGVLYHKHVHEGFNWEGWLGFYPLYGFIAYSLVVVLGLGLQKIVTRKEGYYDD